MPPGLPFFGSTRRGGYADRIGGAGEGRDARDSVGVHVEREDLNLMVVPDVRSGTPSTSPCELAESDLTGYPVRQILQRISTPRRTRMAHASVHRVRSVLGALGKTAGLVLVVLLLETHVVLAAIGGIPGPGDHVPGPPPPPCISTAPIFAPNHSLCWV